MDALEALKAEAAAIKSRPRASCLDAIGDPFWRGVVASFVNDKVRLPDLTVVCPDQGSRARVHEVLDIVRGSVDVLHIFEPATLPVLEKRIFPFIRHKVSEGRHGRLVVIESTMHRDFENAMRNVMNDVHEFVSFWIVVNTLEDDVPLEALQSRAVPVSPPKLHSRPLGPLGTLGPLGALGRRGGDIESIRMDVALSDSLPLDALRAAVAAEDAAACLSTRMPLTEVYESIGFSTK